MSCIRSGNELQVAKALWKGGADCLIEASRGRERLLLCFATPNTRSPCGERGDDGWYTASSKCRLANQAGRALDAAVRNRGQTPESGG